jgi:transcriptional regulator GlxA family with amidase domain
MHAMSARTVVIVAFPGVQSLDVTGPLEVFHTASLIAGGGYDVRVATVDGATVAASSGLRLAGDLALADVGAIDTLIVAGGDGTRPHRADPRLVDWLRERAPDARRVASVCSGAFLLAAAGLLDGRRVTSHWAVCRELARRYPAIDVDPEPIYTRDGELWTSAGVTAGMDLALAIVEEDLGRGVALGVARGLVLFLRRPGGQSQFSAQLASQFAERDAIRDLQQWMLDHPEGDLSVEAMAERVAMSPRHFARRFRAEVGETPARYVERVRVEAARRRLEDSAEAIDAVAPACGFGTTETMRRAFVRALGVAPAEYRRRFQSPVPVP